MGCKYVKEFDFGPEKVQVKAYARGGNVKVAPTNKHVTAKPAKPQPLALRCGGKIYKK